MPDPKSTTSKPLSVSNLIAVTSVVLLMRVLFVSTTPTERALGLSVKSSQLPLNRVGLSVKSSQLPLNASVIP